MPLIDWLAPTHNGRGIMTDACQTLLHDWSHSRQGVQKVTGVVFTGNPGSEKVLRKLGFSYRETVAHPDEMVKGVSRPSSILFDWPPVK